MTIKTDSTPANARQTLLSAAIGCAHSIDENRIILHRDRSKDGNALHQLGNRLDAARAQQPGPISDVQAFIGNHTTTTQLHGRDFNRMELAHNDVWALRQLVDSAAACEQDLLAEIAAHTRVHDKRGARIIELEAREQQLVAALMAAKAALASAAPVNTTDWPMYEAAEKAIAALILGSAA